MENIIQREPDICLGQKVVPEGYFNDRFYVEFDTEVEEQEIVNLINESGLSTTSLHIDGDIYYILPTNYSADYSTKLESLFNPIPEVKSIRKRMSYFTGVEFYKNVSPSEAKKIVKEVVEKNGILVRNINYFDIGLKRRSSAYIDIPQDSEFNAIEWVCKFRKNKIVKDARLQSSKAYLFG
jgi:hypothetical protein